MSDTDNLVYSNHLPLLTLKGRVSVYLLDGHVLEGDLASQDAFNIFLFLEDEPLMIPRSQIRFIKGRPGQLIEVDTSHASFQAGLQPPPPVETRTVVEPQSIEQELELEEMVEAEEFDEEGTMILPSTNEVEGMFEDEDSTVIIPLADEEVDTKEDSGTVILTSLLDDDDDQTDTTLVVDLETLPGLLGEDEDATVVIEEEAEQKEVSATVTCISGPHAGESIKLKSGITTIGRSTDNIIVLNRDKEISRHHAIIIHESGQFVIQDQNSLNGTFVNDEQITEPRYLEDGDLVLVGVSTFRYQED